MAKIDVLNKDTLNKATQEYIDAFPGELMCALQLWYEGLGGMGTPTTAEMQALNEALVSLKGWKDVGGVRYEKFGVQQSVARVK